MPIDTNKNRDLKTPEPKQFGGSLFILFGLLLMLNLFLFRGPRYPITAYSDFLAQVEAGKVEQVEISPNRIRYNLKSESIGEEAETQPSQVVETIPLVTDLELPNILREHNVRFFVRPANGLGWLRTLLSWVVPPLIFFGIWGFQDHCNDVLMQFLVF